MKIKTRLIGLDLDGTLLTSKKELTEHTKEILKKAIDQGIVVMPVTGRPISGIPKELLELPGIRYAVTANGGRIVDVATGESLYENLVPREIARKILKIFYEYDTLKEIYFNGTGYVNSAELDNISHYMPDRPMADYILSTRHPVEDIWEKFEKETGGMDKVHCILADPSQKDSMKKRLSEIPEIEVSGSLKADLEVNARGVNKGNALLKLGEILEIAREEIMAFGDASNDFSMIEKSGIGVAMANAEEELKEAADYIADSNDEEGVARFIEEHVLD